MKIKPSNFPKLDQFIKYYVFFFFFRIQNGSVLANFKEVFPFLSSPENTVVVVGDRMVMKCGINRTTSVVSWHFISTETQQEIQLYNKEIGLNSNYKDILNVEKKMDESVNIYSNSTRKENAGVYICKRMMNDTTLLTDSAQLVVLEKKPSCPTTDSGSIKVGDVVRMHCRVGYRGNWAPTMEWRRSDGTVIKDGIQTNTTSFVVKSELTFEASSTMNDAFFICRTYFTESNRSKVDVNRMATNIPEYNFTFISTSLNITYGPKNLTIIPDQNSYNSGDILSCSSDVNPSSTYEWKELESGRMSTGFTFKIKRNRSFEIQLTAVNPGGNTTREKKITINASDPKLYLPIALGMLCVLLIVMIIVILLSRRNTQGLSFCPYACVTAGCCCRDREPKRFEPLPNLVTNENATQSRRNSEEEQEPNNDRRENKSLIGLPLYATVNKKKMTPKDDDYLKDSLKTIGADGIEYAEMNEMRQFHQPSKFHPPPPHPSIFFETSTYASIDHTIAVPPLKT